MKTFVQTRQGGPGLLLLGILLFVLANGSYFILRYAGQWSEGDTVAFARVIDYLRQTGELFPGAAGNAYPHGPAYPVLSSMLTEIAGISAQTLLAAVYPLTVVLVALAAFILYRSMIGSAVTALLATLLLFMMPDFLWVTFRGTHEKFTWMLVALAFFALSKSFASANRPSLVIRFILLFYLIVFALIATNALFASSFIFAILFAFLGGTLIEFRRRRREPRTGNISLNQTQRLLLVMLTCLVLLFLFIFYLYPPALAGLRSLQSATDQVGVMVLNLDPQNDPYQYVPETWTSPGVYLALTMFNYIILLLSFVVWVKGLWGYAVTVKASLPKPSFYLLWLLYPAFALQLAASVILDYSGAMAGNLQLRVFTPVMLIAIPLATIGIMSIWRRLKHGLSLKLFIGLSLILVCWFSLAALLKATNEPALSNQWLMYTTAERQAGTWIAQRGAAAWVWVEDRRILTAFQFLFTSNEEVKFDTWSIKNQDNYFLLSDFERAKYVRLNQSPPDFWEEHKVYDNGSARLMHRRPRTPYQ